MKHLNLVQEDKSVLEGTEWLNDSINHAAQSLLKRVCQIEGLQSPLLGSRFKPIKGRKAFIQILNVNNNHWVTVSNKVGDLVFTDNVYVYDSLQHTRIAMTIKKQVCTFFKSTESYIFFNVVDMKRQNNTYDCGVFAITAATDIACGKDPAKSQCIA